METRIVELDLGGGATALVRVVEVADDEVEVAEKVGWADRFDFTEVTATLAGVAEALRPAVAAAKPHKMTVELGLELVIAGEVEAAYALLEPGARRSALTAEAGNGPTDRLLALARLDSGLSPAATEAHFRLATVALLRGDPAEAAAAMADCADHVAPFERADFVRRLDRLASAHPEMAGTVAGLQAVLVG